MDKFEDFKRLAGLISSRASKTEAKVATELPDLGEAPVDLIGSGERAVEIASVGEMKLGLASAPHNPPTNPHLVDPNREVKKAKVKDPKKKGT